MRIHHLSCGSLCPHGARLIVGEGGLLAPAKFVCHCLLIETDDSLVLVDTGFGTEDARNRGRLGVAFRALRARPALGETAVRQLEALGFSSSDGPRYKRVHWKHNPNWVRHDGGGEDWFGFEGVRILPGIGTEVLLIPLIGHTRGHTAIAVHDGDRWLLHCGDAYFNHGELATPPSCPPAIRLFQAAMAADNSARRANRERLRELAATHGDEVTLLCAHDPYELEREQARAGAAAAAA